MKYLFPLLALGLTAAPAHAASVSTTDIIATPDFSYGFEDLPQSSAFGSVVISGNITVMQVLGDPNGIWTSFPFPGQEGSRSWYPIGGDLGYTVIKTTDGADLSAFGFLSGNGEALGTVRTAHYSLRRNGVEVASGSYANSAEMSYIGFSDAIFDEIYLMSTSGPTDSFSFFGDRTRNTLAIDAIEMKLADAPAVPLPAGGLLLLSGLAAAGLVRRRG